MVVSGKIEEKENEKVKAYINLDINGFQLRGFKLYEDEDKNIKLLNPSVYDLRGTKDVSAQEHGGKLEAYNIRLYDVFPMSVDAGSIEASSSDPITLEVEFSYNYFLVGDEIEEAQGA